MQRTISYVLACILAGSLLVPAPRLAQASSAVANGVVGAGTPASCTYAELLTEMGAAGHITFACGAAPHIIILAANGGVQPLAGAGTTLDGGGLITLSGANVANNRLFDVIPTAALTLTHLTLSNATTSAYGGGALRNRGRLVLDDVVLQSSGAQGFWGGGGIWNQSGTLFIRNSTLRANYSAGGGALYNDVAATAIIEGSTFLSNTVGSSLYGGAISNSGVMTVTGSSFAGNSAALISDCPSATNYICGGGAVANLAGATLVVSTTTFTRNTTDEFGGAILNRSYLRLADSIVSQNEAWLGGGVANGPNATAVLTQVVLRGNRQESGAMYNSSGSLALLTDVTIAANTGLLHGVGFDNNQATAWLTNTAVTGNTSTDYGGGITNRNGSVLTLTQVTISGNHGGETGTGLWNYQSTARLYHVTMFGNTAAPGANAGGIYNHASSHLYLTDVLLVANTPYNCTDQPPDTATYNLSTDATCFTAINGNQVNTPQGLGPLANNGGVTLTQLPAQGSPAINNGTCIGGLVFDQRGLPRLVGASCDMGAVERQLVDFGWYLALPLVVR